jgi:1-aminocyclopropane-1-carboxylate deaminase
MVFKASEHRSISDWVRTSCEGSPLLLGRKAFWPESRLQRLKGDRLWIKRDDELSFTLSGPKYRKFAGLSRAMKGHDHIISWGSRRSAFLLGLSQMAKEEGRSLELIFLQSSPYQDFGADVLYQNAFAAHRQHWLSRQDWHKAATLAHELGSQEGPTLVLPEGGASVHSLPGALSLGLDLTEQSLSLGLDFREIWVDSGSGFTAQALILALGTILKNPPEVHVVLCAGTEEDFRLGLSERLEEARGALSSAAWQAAAFHCHKPILGASYGSTPAAVWQKISKEHQDQGILLDPLYTAKLMLTFEAHRDTSVEAKGETLLIHSGGTLNNFGFRSGLRVYES